MCSTVCNPPEFLTAVFGSKPVLNPDNPSRPYVTITFAQTLDAMIAAEKGRRLHISCDEAYDMTHWYEMHRFFA